MLPGRDSASETDDELIDDLIDETVTQIPPEATQWMSRSIVEECDVIEGGFRVSLSTGQRQAAVHLPFSPAFGSIPDFECEPLDDSDVRIRTTAVHSYGVRIEVIRSANLETDECVEIGWCASAAATERAAA